MKQANISIDTAKAMYQQGGVARQFALDNFTEQELTKKALPKTWEEAVVIDKEYEYWYIDTSSGLNNHTARNHTKINHNLWPSKELAEACLALSQLAVLRDAYRGGWEQKLGENAYSILIGKNGIETGVCFRVNVFLSFPTPELRDEFLANFEPLILKAQPLL